ncbi:MAG: glycosyltransferase [Candidatus Liptonbacteria bacterium]|nr:glycosyltransferase [Candidatus Liptonbacteria bacterium]
MYMALWPLVVTLCICFQAERGIFDSLSYLSLFRQLKRPKAARDHEDSVRSEKQTLFVLIPVFKEQKIIEDGLLNFCKIQSPHFEIKIAIVATIRETSRRPVAGIPTTEEMVARSMSSGKLSAYRNRIYIFRETEARGNMATQLNHAIRKIKSLSPADTFFLVYNADSIISDTTFSELAELMEQHPSKGFAFQEPCAFVRDMHPNSNRFTNALSLYQSWYCLGHESRLIRAYHRKTEKHWGRKDGRKLGVIVGHGSGMTLSINTSSGGYPSDLLTEDLTFAFILSARGAPILSLPALEIADVPDNFLSFIKQKSVWFWNILSYASCYQKMLNEGHSRARLIPLLIQGLGWGAYWFFDTFFVIVPFIISAMLGSYWLALLAMASFLIFYIISQYFLLKKLPATLRSQGFPQFAQNVEAVSFINILPTLCLIILTNSVGAWVATLKGIGYLCTGKLPTKYKTGD